MIGYEWTVYASSSDDPIIACGITDDPAQAVTVGVRPGSRAHGAPRAIQPDTRRFATVAKHTQAAHIGKRPEGSL
jgi:hypothetical protein